MILSTSLAKRSPLVVDNKMYFCVNDNFTSSGRQKDQEGLDLCIFGQLTPTRVFPLNWHSIWCFTDNVFVSEQTLVSVPNHVSWTYFPHTEFRNVIFYNWCERSRTVPMPEPQNWCGNAHAEASPHIHTVYTRPYFSGICFLVCLFFKKKCSLLCYWTTRHASALMSHPRVCFPPSRLKHVSNVTWSKSSNSCSCRMKTNSCSQLTLVVFIAGWWWTDKPVTNPGLYTQIGWCMIVIEYSRLI